MNDPQLFDPERTIPTACPVGHCEAIRLPGQDRVVTCSHDLEPAHPYRTKRPKGCLNAIDNRYQGIPY